MSKLRFPEWAQQLEEPWRYTVVYGGRGGGKSYTVAEKLIQWSMTTEEHRGCAYGVLRQFQDSIRDSNYSLIVDRIEQANLEDDFYITKTELLSKRLDIKFLFAGLDRSIDSIKGKHRLVIGWLEEGQTIKREALDKLFPTVREEGSRIIITMNPESTADPVWKEFIEEKRPNTKLIQVGYDDNPWISKTFVADADLMRERDFDNWRHIYGGECRKISKASIFGDKIVVKDFDESEFLDEELAYGFDVGYGKSQSSVVKCYLHDDTIYLADMIYLSRPHMDELMMAVQRFVPRGKTVRVDSASPETVDMLIRMNVAAVATKKGAGSVSTGISWLRSRKAIVIKPSLTDAIQELPKYSYKVDNNGDISPEINKNTPAHIPDSIRYAFEPQILTGTNKVVNPLAAIFGE